MAAVDTALQRAEWLSSWVRGNQPAAPPPPPVAAGAGELDPSDPPPTQDPPMLDPEL
jgi:hypothetical protein